MMIRNSHKSNSRNCNGFTVVELMMVLAVAAILLGVALPSFSHLLHKNRLNTTTSDLYASLNVARSTAIKQRQSVSLCPTTDGESCETADADWSTGWMVFEDSDRDGVKDNGENVIRWNSSIHDAIEIATGLDQVTFNPTGDARLTTGSFQVCHAETKAKSKQVSVSAVGRINASELEMTTCEDAS